MHVTGRLMIASVGSTIVGSARSSNRMSRAPYNTAPCMSHLSFVDRGRRAVAPHRVARLLEQGVRLADDVGLIHLLAPVIASTSSNATDTDSSPYRSTFMTSSVIACASRCFCCSDLPGHSFTIK